MKTVEFVADLRENEVNEFRVPVQWLNHHLPDPKDQREYVRERCRVVVTEAIGEAIESSGLNRVQIAKKLGVTKGHISQVLSGTRNMTLRTLGDLLWACGVEANDLETRALGVIMASPDVADEWLQSCKATITYDTIASPLITTHGQITLIDSQIPVGSMNLALAA